MVLCGVVVSGRNQSHNRPSGRDSPFDMAGHDVENLPALARKSLPERGTPLQRVHQNRRTTLPLISLAVGSDRSCLRPRSGETGPRHRVHNEDGCRMRNVDD
jgi:hypothetical protein